MAATQVLLCRRSRLGPHLTVAKTTMVPLSTKDQPGRETDISPKGQACQQGGGPVWSRGDGVLGENSSGEGLPGG